MGGIQHISSLLSLWSSHFVNSGGTG